MTNIANVTEWRRHLHQYPEFGTKEFITSEFVANKLEEFGIEVHRGIGGTGVLGILKMAQAIARLVYVRTWMRCVFMKRTLFVTLQSMKERCTLVDMMAIPRCYWVRRKS